MNTQDYIALENALRRDQLQAAGRRAGARPGHLGVGCGRQPLPGLPLRLLGGEPGPLPPEDRRGDAGAGREADAHLARLPQRPAGAVLQGAVRADPLAHGPADEQRRRGRRVVHQGGAQVGLPGQGRARRPGRDHRLREQLPRPHHHHRRLQHRAAVPRRLRALHARLQDHPLRRRAGAGRRHHAQHGGLPGRADPGRGRHHRPAGGLPARGAAHLHASTTSP